MSSSSDQSQQSRCCYDFSGRVTKDLRVDSLQTGKFGICCTKAAQTFGNNEINHIEHWESTGNTLGVGNTTRYIEINEDLDTVLNQDNILILNRPIAAVLVAISRTQFTPPTQDIGTWAMEIADTTATAFPGSASEPLTLGSQDNFIGQFTYVFNTALPALTRWSVCFNITNSNNPGQAPQLAGSIAVVYAD